MRNLLAKKPLSALLAEAHQEGEHTLKRTLGPFSLTALGSAQSLAPASLSCRDWEPIMQGQA